MKPVTEWLGQYSQISENLLALLEEGSGGYSDEKLASIEATMEVRQELLEELSGLEIKESERSVYEGFLGDIGGIETKIESLMKTMMSELDEQRLAVQDQRSELNRLKRANRSYVGTVKSAEGYFIDKKK